MDMINDVQKSTDLEYLKQLEDCVDIDIKNHAKKSDMIKTMMAKSSGISVEEWDKKQLDQFIDLKNKIQKRISELTK